MDTDLRNQIEASFGDGPLQEHPSLLVERGRRALRFRRVAAGAAGAGVAAIAVGSALLLSGGPAETGSVPPASRPTASDNAHPSDTTWPAQVSDRGSDPGDPVELGRDGRLHVSKDVTVIQLRRHPWPVPEGTHAVALSYRRDGDGTTYWYAESRTGPDGTAAGTARLKGQTFDEWVAEQGRDLLQGGGE